MTLERRLRIVCFKPVMGTTIPMRTITPNFQSKLWEPWGYLSGFVSTRLSMG